MNITYSQEINSLENNLDIQNQTEVLENNNWNYSNYPKDINVITREELEYLNLLTINQVNSFFWYRRFVQKFYSIYELLDIPNFDILTLKKLQPYLTLNHQLKYTKSDYLLLQTNRTLNTTSSPYKGLSRNQYQLRFKKTLSKHLTLGLAADSDIGETINFNKQRGANHTVGYIEIKNKLGFNKLIIGNYQNHYGQGLLFSNQFFNGKSSRSAFNSYFNSDETTPYKSMGEVGYLNGISGYKKIKSFKLYGWLSSVRISGTRKSRRITSIYKSGYFRNSLELNKRNIATEFGYGGRLSMDAIHNRLKIGFSYARFSYSLPVQLYYLDKAINTFFNTGIDYLYRTKHIEFFGEVVIQNKNTNQIHGFQTTFDERTKISMIYRKYNQNYFNLRANGFSTYSNNRNEEGIYLSINHKLTNNIKFFSFYDQFSNLIPAYGKKTTPINSEWSAGIKLLLSESSTLRFTLLKRNLNNETPNDKIAYNTKVTSRHYFFNLKTTFKDVFITTNIQHKSINENESINLGQYFTVKTNKINYTIGYNLFSIPEYNIRLYQYQPDLTYNNSFNLLINKGYQVFGILKYKLKNKCTVSTKIVMTEYSDRDILTRGNEEIKSNKVITAKLQILFKL